MALGSTCPQWPCTLPCVRSSLRAEHQQTYTCTCKAFAKAGVYAASALLPSLTRHGPGPTQPTWHACAITERTPNLLASTASVLWACFVFQGCEGQACSAARLLEHLRVQPRAVRLEREHQLAPGDALLAVQASAPARNFHQPGKALLVLRHGLPPRRRGPHTLSALFSNL